MSNKLREMPVHRHPMSKDMFDTFSVKLRNEKIPHYYAPDKGCLTLFSFKEDVLSEL